MLVVLRSCTGPEISRALTAFFWCRTLVERGGDGGASMLESEPFLLRRRVKARAIDDMVALKIQWTCGWCLDVQVF
jgi:hypothetical protein